MEVPSSEDCQDAVPEGLPAALITEVLGKLDTGAMV